MFKQINIIVMLLVVLGLTGCAGLGKMKDVQFETVVASDKSMVNIVRRSIFLGDGAEVEAWDGDKFIGTLSSGKLLQYPVEPGIHTFMVYMQGSWGVAKGDLKPGKTYYLKFNMSGFGPISLGVAKATDPRIEKWNMMDTITIDQSLQKAVPEKYIQGAKKILKRITDGKENVTPITDINAL
ncbi:MAG: hypothetical protein HRU24_11775 [Gammaproteobacteria bacterium]|nr:hypothetical protein [Gammaproteobacteria bacterium]